MDEKEAEKIEQEISISLKEKIANLSNKDAEKIIEEEVRKRGYLSEDWQIGYAVRRIKEMAKEKPQESQEKEPEIKSFKFYWFWPGTPRQIAKAGLIITLAGGIAMLIFEGSLLGDVFTILGAYGQLLLLVALIKWIRNKIRKKRASSH